MSTHRWRTTASLVIGIAALAVLGISTATWFAMEGVYSNSGRTTSSSATARSHPAAAKAADVPDIDWEYWHKVNPQIIGWITVPGTPVDYPVVDPPVNDASFYLTHDVYRSFNWFGCVYRDPDCTDSNVRNCILYGHNMGWSNKMFGTLASYTDTAFMQAHSTAILQTPDKVQRYRVCAAQVINGWEAHKHTRFTDANDFTRWWKGVYEASETHLHRTTPAARCVLTLCTCSYHQWDNERTLVYAIPERDSAPGG